jgi:hypothetical protein
LAGSGDFPERKKRKMKKKASRKPRTKKAVLVSQLEENTEVK